MAAKFNNARHGKGGNTPTTSDVVGGGLGESNFFAVTVGAAAVNVYDGSFSYPWGDLAYKLAVRGTSGQSWVALDSGSADATVYGGFAVGINVAPTSGPLLCQWRDDSGSANIIGYITMSSARVIQLRDGGLGGTVSGPTLPIGEMYYVAWFLDPTGDGFFDAQFKVYDSRGTLLYDSGLLVDKAVNSATPSTSSYTRYGIANNVTNAPDSGTGALWLGYLSSGLSDFPTPPNWAPTLARRGLAGVA